MITLLPQLIAQNLRNPAFNSLSNMDPTEFFGGLIPALVSLGLVIGAIVFLFYFIIGAIGWITSGGDKMKTEQARNKITTALVGLVILFSFIAILSLAERFFGIGMRRIEVGPFRIELVGDSVTEESEETCGTPDHCVPPQVWCDYPDCTCAQHCQT